MRRIVSIARYFLQVVKQVMKQKPKFAFCFNFRQNTEQLNAAGK